MEIISIGDDDEETEEIQDEEERQDEPLLDHLLTEGLLPRFSFPLDVCDFTAQGGRRANWKKGEGSFPDFPVEEVFATTSQDRKVALSEYAPGRIVEIRKEKYRVAGLGFPYTRGVVNRAQGFFEKEEEKHRGWYLHCTTGRDNDTPCDFVSKNIKTKTEDIDNLECPACGHKETLIQREFVIPKSFAPEIAPMGSPNNTNVCTYDMIAKNPDDERQSNRSRLVSAQLPTPLNDDELSRELGDSGESDWNQLEVIDGWGGVECYVKPETILISVHKGDRDDNGFSICLDCGRCELEGDPNRKLDTPHNRPYAITRLDYSIASRNYDFKNNTDERDKWKEGAHKQCPGTNVNGPYYLAHWFHSDVFVLRIRQKGLLDERPHPNHPGLFSAAISLKEAFLSALQNQLHLSRGEVKAGVRRIQHGGIGCIDIFIYDNVAGGAGLVSRLNDNGLRQRVLEESEDILSGSRCVESLSGETEGCERACVGCLIDFRNKRESGRLDRDLGLQLLGIIKGNNELRPNKNIAEKNLKFAKAVLQTMDYHDKISVNPIEEGGVPLLEVTNNSTDLKAYLEVCSGLSTPSKIRAMHEDISSGDIEKLERIGNTVMWPQNGLDSIEAVLEELHQLLFPPEPVELG